MITLGSVMALELHEDLVRALSGRDVGVLHLGDTVSRVPPTSLPGLAAVVVALTEEVVDSEISALGIAVAGVVVDSESVAHAEHAGVTWVLRGPDDLDTFVRGLSDPVAKPATPVEGHIIAVWGPAGAPGRTTVALSLAGMLSRRRDRVVLVDGDTYCPAISPLLALPPGPPGIIAACRVARLDAFDSDAVLACATTQHTQGGSLHVLSGLRSATQHADCTAPSWSRVLEVLRAAGYAVVVDVAEPLEQFATEVLGGPLRNAVGIATLRLADSTIVVGRAEPLSILRLSRAWVRLQELSSTARTEVLLSAVGAHQEALVDESLHSLWQFTGHDRVTCLGFDRALPSGLAERGAALLEANPKSPLVRGLTPLVSSLVPESLHQSPRSTTLRPAHPGRPWPGSRVVAALWQRAGAKRLL